MDRKFDYMCKNCTVKFVPFKEGVTCPRCNTQADAVHEGILDKAWMFASNTEAGRRPRIFTAEDAAVHFLSDTWEKFAEIIRDTRTIKEAEQAISRGFKFRDVKYRYSRELAKHSIPYFLKKWSRLSKSEKEKIFLVFPEKTEARKSFLKRILNI